MSLSDRLRRLRDQLWFEQGGYCILCMRPIGVNNASLDHVVPAAFGGSKDDDNFLVACRRCNQLRGNMPLVVFMRLVDTFIRLHGNGSRS